MTKCLASDWFHWLRNNDF